MKTCVRSPTLFIQQAVDPEFYKNLIWMLENDITHVLDLNFTEEVDYFGRTETVELKPGGAGIKVTEGNKREYVNLVARHRMTTAIKAQIGAFLEGFWELVPKVCGMVSVTGVARCLCCGSVLSDGWRLTRTCIALHCRVYNTCIDDAYIS